MSIDELDEAQMEEYERICDADINWETYFEENGIYGCLDDPRAHYIKHWHTNFPVVPDFFDTRGYLELYPDIRDARVNPLLHYIVHGKNERRDSCLNTGTTIPGGIKNNPNLKTLVLASHESSATGAPLLGLNIARAFGTKYNIIHIVTTRSDLHEEFRKHCEILICGARGDLGSRTIMRRLSQARDLYAVICNSVETYDVLKASSELGLPTVSLIHEFADYTRPIGKMSRAVLCSNEVIVPAAVVKDSISRELNEIHGVGTPPDNVHVLAQGKLPWLPGKWGNDDSQETLIEELRISDRANTRVIVAGGVVHIRKGVDLFVSLAQLIRRKYSKECRFLWVGSGYEPSEDLSYSFWIRKQVELSGLSDSLFFLGHQRDLDKVFAVADVFCLTSRLDPFPNMVIDALSNNVHVACFRGGTGCADFLLESGADCTVVDNLDIEIMANEIVKYLDRPLPPGMRNSELVRTKLGFSKYLRALEDFVDAAHAAKAATHSV